MSLPKTIVFFCKHDVGVAALQKLINFNASVSLVVVQEPETATRWFQQLVDICDHHAIDVLKVSRLSKDKKAIQRIAETGASLGITVLFTQIIPPSVIASIPDGIVNFHPSLLPKYRGPHPVNWAIVNGETRSGVTAHFVTDHVDAGPILRQDEFDITEHDTNFTVMEKVNDLILMQLDRIYAAWQEDALEGVPQDESRATYFRRRTPADGEIRFTSMTAGEIRNLVRALQPPLPGAFFDVHGTRVVARSAQAHLDVDDVPGRITSISSSHIGVGCASGIVLLRELQADGEPFDPTGSISAGARLDG